MNNKTDLIWIKEDYVGFLRHEYPLIRSWAIERLTKFHLSEVNDEVAEMLKDESEDVVWEAIGYFGESGSKEYCDKIFDVYRNTESRIVRSACVRVLGKLKYHQAEAEFIRRLKNSQSIEDIYGLATALNKLGVQEAYEVLHEKRKKAEGILKEMLWDMILQYENVDDVRLFLKQCFNGGFPADRTEHVFGRLARLIHCNDLFDSFKGTAGNPRAVFYIAEKFYKIPVKKYFGHKSLKQIFKGRDYSGAVKEAAAGKRDFAGKFEGEDCIEKARVGKVLGTVREKLLNLILWEQGIALEMMELFGEHFSKPRKTPGNVEIERVFFLSVYLHIARDKELFDILMRKEKGLDFWIRVFSSEREYLPEEINDVLISSKNEVISKLISIINKSPDSRAAIRATGLLGKIRAQEAIPSLIKNLSKKRDSFLCEASADALRNIGRPVLSYINPGFNGYDSSQKIYLAGVLGDLPYERSAEIITGNFDMLLRDIYFENVYIDIRKLGYEKAIEPVRKEWRPGEYIIGETLYFLCLLHDRQFPEFSLLKTEVEKKNLEINKRKKQFLSNEEIDQLGHIELYLKCRKCGKSFHYRINKIIFAPDEERKSKNPDEDYLIMDEIICKNCGAVDEYEFTNTAHVALTVELMKMTALAEAGKHYDPDDYPLAVAKGWMTCEGKKLRMKDAIERYEKKIKKERNRKKNAFYYNRLGNLYMKRMKIEEAEYNFRKSIELDPEGMHESYYSLGLISMKEGRYLESKELFKKALYILSNSKIQDKNKFIESIEDCLEEIDRKTKHLHPKTDFTVKAEDRPVGRNDPCPCGSGKKYKKCCLPKKEPSGSVITQASNTGVIRNADRYEIDGCYINPDWKESGFARIVVTRKQDNQKSIMGVYMVDIFCVGVKGAICNCNFNPADIEKKILPRYYPDSKPMRIGINYAKEIIFGAVEYADKIGLKPDEDFELARHVLGKQELFNYHNVKFGGPNGKPLYVAGPFDDSKAIIKKLNEILGEGNYDYMLEVKE